MTARRARVLMVQGTSSHVGKSVLTAALCRIFAQEGLEVAPFKAQNMSLNAAVTLDGGEIGRAQAVQAQAARTLPCVEMNPVLLKPEADYKSQVVVMGKPLRRASAREYLSMKAELWPLVTQALDSLRADNDLAVIEGAGSPAEINLKQHEIVNMRVARYADAPVLLVGDIDRGGVFASLFGTVALLEPEERALVKAFVINKFRGDPTILDPGLVMLQDRTGIPTAGVLPYYKDIHIPEEDSLGLDAGPRSDGDVLLDIAVLRLPRIANADDFDPLRREPGIQMRFVADTRLLGEPDLLIIPGSKSTVADLEWLRERGLAGAIIAKQRSGTAVIGICGGFQMLGERILDPAGAESERRETGGMGLLPVVTTFSPEKTTHLVLGHVTAGRGLLSDCLGVALNGYEIHMGRSIGADAQSPFQVTQRSGRAIHDADGALDAAGWTLGTYIHGLFHNQSLRRGMLQALARRKGVTPPPPIDFDQDREFDRLADLVRAHLDMGMVRRMAGLPEGRHG